MAYLYRHIRLDKNIPFYIGIGSDEQYRRAYLKSGRNRFWKRIVSKIPYEVEIILDNLTWEEANRKEIEFIALYKRKNDGGTLTNHTLGGGGILGFKHSKRSRNKIAEAGMGRLQSTETRMKKSKSKIGVKFSEEHKKNLSLSHKGFIRSERSKKLQRETIFRKKSESTRIIKDLLK